MARPIKNDIDSGIQNWDGKIDDNDEVLFNGPLPIHEHTGDESDLEATFAAAAYDRCLVWVDNTELGWTIYESTGSIWRPALNPRRLFFDLTSTTSMSEVYHGAFVRFSGTGTVDFDLEPAADWAGEEVVVRNDKSSGTLNIDPNGSEQINSGGAGTALTIAVGETATLYSNGSTIYASVAS